MTDFRDWEQGIRPTTARRRSLVEPDVIRNADLFAAQIAAADRRDAAAAHVATHRDETYLVGHLVQYLRGLRAPFTADVAGAWLDQRGVPRELKIRRRLISTAINAGRGRYWFASGYVQGLAGRPMTQWTPTESPDAPTP